LYPDHAPSLVTTRLNLPFQIAQVLSPTQHAPLFLVLASLTGYQRRYVWRKQHHQKEEPYFDELTAVRHDECA
jgi:hypothetical protein